MLISFFVFFRLTHRIMDIVATAATESCPVSDKPHTIM